MAGKTLAAAAAAGMSERAARKWQSGSLPSTAKAPRWWRTREDPFADVWQSEVMPQLVADTDGRLQVLTLFKALCRRHPGRFQPAGPRVAGGLRSRPRGVLRAGSGPGSGSGVRLHRLERPGGDASGCGVPARWTYVELALSETFEALVSGLQHSGAAVRCSMAGAEVQLPRLPVGPADPSRRRRDHAARPSRLRSSTASRTARNARRAAP